jgi:hypothetical protein
MKEGHFSQMMTPAWRQLSSQLAEITKGSGVLECEKTFSKPACPLFEGSFSTHAFARFRNRSTDDDILSP